MGFVIGGDPLVQPEPAVSVQLHPQQNKIWDGFYRGESMSNESSSSGSLELSGKILAALKNKPGQKATDLARVLEVDRPEINRCLNGELAGKVQQDRAYRWSLVGTRPAQVQPDTGASAPTTEIGRLTRYYLECIGEDNDQGVSEFASSQFVVRPCGGHRSDWQRS